METKIIILVVINLFIIGCTQAQQRTDLGNIKVNNDSVHLEVKKLEPIDFDLKKIMVGKANIPIKCCGINQVIPNFKADTINGFSTYENRNLLIEKKFVLPITQSKSPIEIRLWYSIARSSTELIDINCINGSMQADSYEAFIGSAKDSLRNISDGYQDLGSPFSDSSLIKSTGGDATLINQIKKMNMTIFFKKKSNIKLTQTPSWDMFFKELIEDHLYDLPSQEILNKIALEYNPNASYPLDCLGGDYFELKVGKYYRSMTQSCDYSPPPKTLELINCKQNIWKILLQFEH